MHVLWECVFCALVVIRNVGTSGELTNTQGHLLHADERNFTKQDPMKQEAFEQLQALPGSTFNLRVQVNDMLSRQPLSRAALDLFVNHRLNSTALSEEDGSVRLRVPFHSGLPITVVASKKGFISALLLCKTSKIPIFSSIIVPLLRLNQGNIWLFEDTVLITGRTAAAVSQPTVRFPQSLLNLTHSRNISSIRAYLTVPKLTSQQDSSLNTLGIISSQSGGWMRKGLGMMNLVEGKLMWTFTAPHLGYWIATPLSPNRGVFGFPALLEFISQHSFFLTVLVGGTLFAFILFLLGLLCFCRRKILKNKTRKASTVMRKDQTTSTVHDEESEASSALQHADGENQRSNRCLDSFLTMKSGEVIANRGAAAVPSECNTLDVINMTSEQTQVPSCHPNGLFFYNQPLAILPAPAFFHLEEHPEQVDWSRSATLPRVGASNGAAAEPQRKESFTQTFHTEDQLQSSEGSPGPSNTSRMPFNLPESASVPGTLNKLAGSRHSVQAITGLSKIPSPQPPRAWFVSLEGKPAAEIRYAVSEQQRRRRPMESRETSLDSGVDLSELNQSTGRRPVTLERNATFIKSPSSNKHAPQE
ncbi:protein FAM171B-like isoform X3 [Cyprinodon tularosa]|uniref:protein FAM171B-like isoform X3 n=1 Tax=Cyprinodon tularosa TaxID=77115 RepID=UPI0018E270ED|nr:protein FAM171B-like isoform X3 [Cyprinodon tularosa]